MVQLIGQNREFNLLSKYALLTFKTWALSLAFSVLACRQTLVFKICHLQLVIHHLQFFIQCTYSTQQELSNSIIFLKIYTFPPNHQTPEILEAPSHSYISIPLVFILRKDSVIIPEKISIISSLSTTFDGNLHCQPMDKHDL